MEGKIWKKQYHRKNGREKNFWQSILSSNESMRNFYRTNTTKMQKGLLCIKSKSKIKGKDTFVEKLANHKGLLVKLEAPSIRYCRILRDYTLDGFKSRIGVDDLKTMI